MIMEDKELAFWKWYTKYGLYGTHSEGKTIKDLQDDDIPDFIPIFDNKGKLLNYELDC